MFVAVYRVTPQNQGGDSGANCLEFVVSPFQNVINYRQPIEYRINILQVLSQLVAVTRFNCEHG